jgi:hypothetical protein
VRTKFETHGNQNFNAMRLKGFSYQRDGRDKPLLVFRSGVLMDTDKPSGCLQSLLKHADLKHVVNLYAGRFPLHGFIAEEEQVARSKGATFHNEAKTGRSWRDIIEKPEDYKKNFDQASKQVAKLINTQILKPQDQPPKGNILIHCGGGMHRTGMVVGILQRCINHQPMDEIEAEFKYHTHYRSAEQPGGYEKLNVQFIRDFDCSLIERPR